MKSIQKVVPSNGANVITIVKNTAFIENMNLLQNRMREACRSESRYKQLRLLSKVTFMSVDKNNSSFKPNWKLRIGTFKIVLLKCRISICINITNQHFQEKFHCVPSYQPTVLHSFSRTCTRSLDWFGGHKKDQKNHGRGWSNPSYSF